MFEEFIQKLREDKFITLETTPPSLPTFDRVLDKLEELDIKDLIDGFSCTDNPLAKLKYNAILASIKLQERFKKPVLATVTMRDRNKIALQSDLLGANDFDIRAILALTGDSASISDQPNVKGVFEGNSLELLDIIKCFNAGINFAGREFKLSPKRIYPFSVTNAKAKNMRHIKNKLYKKIDHGSIGVITQPIFDIDSARELISIFYEVRDSFSDERAKAELILGVFPITKFKTAQFLSSHVPGIYVPKSWIDKLFKASQISEEEEFKVGLELSKNLFLKVKEIHPKMHIMTANKFDIAKAILN